MKSLLKALVVTLLIPLCLSAQDDDNWPSLSYLRNDYKAVSVVAHVRLQQAEITGRVGGYENWKVSAVVLESFKGKFKKGDVIEYFQGAEAGLKREYFDGEKIVRFIQDTDHAAVTSRVRAVSARIHVRHVVTNGAVSDGFLHFQDGVGQLLGFLLRCAYHKEGQSLSRL